MKGLRAQDNTRYEFRHRRQGRRYRRTQGGMWEEPRSLTVVHLATSLHASTSFLAVDRFYYLYES